MKRNIRILLNVSAVLLLLASPLFGQEDEMGPIDDTEFDEEEQEQVEPVTEDEIQYFAGIQLTVREAQQELEEEQAEIRHGSGLTATEFRQAEQAVNAAGGDLDEIDESLLEDERFEPVITDLAEIRTQSDEIISDAVSESPVDESRFDELAILISNDRELSQQVNQIVSAEVEEMRAEEQEEAEEEVEADEPEDVEEPEDSGDDEDEDESDSD